MFQRELLCVGDVLCVQLFTKFIVVQFSRSVVSDSLRPHGLQHARPPCPSPAPGICSNSCPSSHSMDSMASMEWCHPTISSSVAPFFSWVQSFPASGLPADNFYRWNTEKRAWALKLVFYPMHKTSLTNTPVLEKLCKPFEIRMLLFNNPENWCGASPCGSAGKESTCSAGELGSIPGLGRIVVRLWTPSPMCVGRSHSYQVILRHKRDVLQLSSIPTLPGDRVRSTG